MGTTAIENQFLTRHIQTVGGANPAPLMPGTSYYWQIYVEDEYGNTGFHDEQSTTTLQEQGRTYVPGDNFEKILIDRGYDDILDDYVLTANIENITSLDVSGNNIADLTGIEDFEALEDLNCSNNTLNNIDVSSNINLITLNVSNNQLSTVNTINNLALTTLNCSNNSIASIDLTQNTNLVVLDISNNVFTSFLPSEVPSLSDFICDGNAIVELDFQLNQNVTSLSCQSNSLEVLNIRNGQNNILTNLNAQNNPDLTCIETDNGTVPKIAKYI